MINFVIDEDMPRSTGVILQTYGYEVKDIRDHGLRGANDETIYQFAKKNHSVLISGDMGFSNILHFPIGNHYGIIVAHFPTEMSTIEINRQLIEKIKELAESDIKGNLVIIEPGRTRIRKRNIF